MGAPWKTIPLANAGVPIQPCWSPSEFDLFGSPSGKLFVVSHQAHDEGNPDERNESVKSKIRVRISRSFIPNYRKRIWCYVSIVQRNISSSDILGCELPGTKDEYWRIDFMYTLTFLPPITATNYESNISVCTPYLRSVSYTHLTLPTTPYV